MKKTFTLLLACILLINLQAQSVREAHTLSVQVIQTQKPYNTTNTRPTAIVKPQNDHHHHGPHCDTPYVTSMSWEAFQAAKQQIASQSFDSYKLDMAKQIVSWNYMTSVQIKEIAGLFSFDSYRLDFAKFAFNYCVNPGEYFMLYDAFTFNSNARALAEHIGMR
jgi:hypothetical protein